MDGEDTVIMTDSTAGSGGFKGNAVTTPLAIIFGLILLGPSLQGLVATFSLPTLEAESKLMDAVDGAIPADDTKLAVIDLLVNGERSCFKPLPSGDGTPDDPSVGPDSEACKTFLNNGTQYPKSAQALLVAIHGQNLTGSEFKVGNTATTGWASLRGGSELKPFTASRFDVYNELPAGALERRTYSRLRSQL